MVTLYSHQGGTDPRSTRVTLVLRQVHRRCIEHEGVCPGVNSDGSPCACTCHWSVD